MRELTVHRPDRRRVAAQVLRDVLGSWLRRPSGAPVDGVSLGHSTELRTVVYLVVGSEVLVEGLMDVSLIPPAWRVVHLLWLAVLADSAFAFGAVTRRHPHLVERSVLRLRGGLLDEVAVPLEWVAGVRRERVSVQGRGVRAVGDRADAVACTVAGTAELAVDLKEPVSLRLSDGRSLVARTLHIAADDPAAAHRVLRAALA